MLVLASQSPRRSEILRQAGIPFVVRTASIDESTKTDESPEEYVQRLAKEKAMAIEAAPGEIVLGADTTVLVDGTMLGKPEHAQDARRMIRLLSGRRHDVLTGIALRDGGTAVCDLAVTSVWFTRMTDEDIGEYVASGEWKDKAGGYAIQGMASKFVEKIDGCYFNVVGLPVSLVHRRLRKLLEY